MKRLHKSFLFIDPQYFEPFMNLAFRKSLLIDWTHFLALSFINSIHNIKQLRENYIK